MLVIHCENNGSLWECGDSEMTISDRLKQKFGSPERSVVRALRNEIEHALSEHWTAKQIWEDLFLKGSIECSYRTFCRLLEKEVAGKKSKNHVDGGHFYEKVIDKRFMYENKEDKVIKKFVFKRVDGADLI